jgi:CubicO group peptidase (beta-lactamase class C family)
MLRRGVLGAAAALVSGAGVSAQQVRAPVGPLPVAAPESIGLSAQRLAQVTEVLAATVAQGRINGAVLGIARQGRLGWLRAVGFRDSAQAEPLRVDAIFPWAGMTKPVASVAAMVLVERGRLKLSDPVSAHLPAFREMRVAVATRVGESEAVELSFERARRPITVQDLLRHTAGMTDGVLYPETPVGRMYAEAGVQAPEQPLGEAMEALAKLPLVRQPGAMWEDSIATDVLARVVEVVSGQAFERFVAREVTEPLRMADTGFVVAAKEHGRLALPRVDPLTGALPAHQDGTVAVARIGGSTGLLGTAGDYLRFGQAMLAGGILDGVRVLGAGTVAHMTSDHLGRIGHDSASGQYLLGEGRGFGLGVSVRLGAGVNAMPGSAGDFDWAGRFGTQFVVDPVRDLVAVLMVNQRNQFDHLFRLFRTLVYQTLAR